MPAASVTQNVAAMARSPMRAVMRSPPPMITAYATIIAVFRGAHQKSSGSSRVLPKTMNTTTSPTFDGLNTWAPR